MIPHPRCSALALCFAAQMSACYSPGGTLGAPCNNSQACNAGEICVMGTCSHPEGSSTGIPGTSSSVTDESGAVGPLEVDGDALLLRHPDGCVGPGVSLTDLLDDGVLVGGDGSAITCEYVPGMGNGILPAGIEVDPQTCEVKGSVSITEPYGRHVWITSVIQGDAVVYVPQCAAQDAQMVNAYSITKQSQGVVSTLKPGVAKMSGGAVSYGTDTPDPRVEVTTVWEEPAFFWAYTFGYSSPEVDAMVSSSENGDLVDEKEGLVGFYHGIHFGIDDIAPALLNRHWVFSIFIDYCIAPLQADCGTPELNKKNGDGSNYAFSVVVRP